MTKTIVGSDGLARCSWCGVEPELSYHDDEWGHPVNDDTRLFEMLSLESFQSGLSWRTILTKRENFRSAFCGFDFNQVAQFDESDISRLLSDKGIVRHRGKIEATINNAQRAKELIQQEGSLSSFFWSYEPAIEKSPEAPIVSTTSESTALSKELKKRGWKFVGPTTVYAFMQSAGLVNDHVKECAMWSNVENARTLFKRPTR